MARREKPVAKIVDGEQFSIITDYLGTPVEIGRSVKKMSCRHFSRTSQLARGIHKAQELGRLNMIFTVKYVNLLQVLWKIVRFNT
ncbi:hypothetical protein [Zobellia uliginosa]|uniref:hypothetical protein n=1 Tax=Zobellia uliginosa TaxID=143224 RepID=UPI0009708D41|nr:hypothetical protein [Zobellia uliginosa]